jgi:hypothetical protein
MYEVHRTTEAAVKTASNRADRVLAGSIASYILQLAKGS